MPHPQPVPPVATCQKELRGRAALRRRESLAPVPVIAARELNAQLPDASWRVGCRLCFLSVANRQSHQSADEPHWLKGPQEELQIHLARLRSASSLLQQPARLHRQRAQRHLQLDDRLAKLRVIPKCLLQFLENPLSAGNLLSRLAEILFGLRFAWRGHSHRSLVTFHSTLRISK